MKKLLGLVAALLVAGIGTARAQCTVQPSDNNWGIGTVFRLSTPQTIGGTTSISTLPVNVLDCGVRATTSTDQTASLQAAINFACGQTNPLNGLPVRPIIYIPPGVYAFTTLSISCSGLTIRGASFNGGASPPSSASTLCSTASAAATMLTIGTAANPVGEVTIEDLIFSGFCGSFPAGVDITCNRCNLNRVNISGYSVFGVRFLGLASANSGGFSTIQNCQIANGQANSFAVVVVTQTGSVGGPDGNTIANCYINTNNGWVNDSTVAGATALRSSQHFLGNRFIGTNAGNITAITGQSDVDRYTNNRFENTGAGGLTIVLNNTTTSNPAAIFMGNLWACGTALCSWSDVSTTKAIRIGEAMGPTTTSQPPGMQQTCQSTSSTASGAGSPATLKTCTIQPNTLSASNPFLHIRAWGSGANNANAKAVRVEFGGVVLITLNLTAGAVAPWQCDVIVAFRTTGSAAQSVGGECIQGAAATIATVTSTTPTLDFTASNAARVTVTQVAAGDVLQDGMTVTACGLTGAGC